MDPAAIDRLWWLGDLQAAYDASRTAAQTSSGEPFRGGHGSQDDAQRWHDHGARCWYLARYDEAQRMLDAAYNVRRSQLGEGHRDTLATAERLAALAEAQGDHDLARERFEHVLDVLRPLEGPNSVAVAIVERNLACTLRSSADEDGATRLLARVDKVFRNQLPDDHVEFLALRKARAYLALLLDNSVDAARHAADAVERTTLPAHHPLVGAVYLLLAQAALKMASLDQAESFLRKATTSFECLGSHPLAAIAIGVHADVLFARGRKDEAVTAARQWRESLERFYTRTAHAFAGQICQRFSNLGALDVVRAETEAMFAVEKPGRLAGSCALYLVAMYTPTRDPELLVWLERAFPLLDRKVQERLKYPLERWRSYFKSGKIKR